MPIEVTCRKCGKILILKETMAGKAGKCPKCGNIIRVPRPVGEAPASAPKMTAHVQGVKVRGGVKAEEVPLRGLAMEGFTRSAALIRVRISTQALLGLVLGIVGLVVALVPSLPLSVTVPPVLALGGGMVGALGAALSGWGLMNIRQQPTRYWGTPLALGGLLVGVLAFIVGLLACGGKTGTAGATAAVTEKREAATVIAGKAELQKCADQLKEVYKLFRSYADTRGGNFPEGPTALIPKYIDSTKPVCCPVAADGTTIYGYNPGLRTDSPPDTPLAYDTPGNHPGGSNVLLVNGEVVWMSAEELKEKLAATAGEGTPPPAREESPSAEAETPSAGGEPSPADEESGSAEGE